MKRRQVFDSSYDKRVKKDFFSIPRSIMHMHASSARHKKFQLLVATIPYLPDELVTEILEWLPISSIVRFSIVSKSWFALFKTSSFIQNHHNKQAAKGTGTMLLLRRRSPPPLVHNDYLSFHNLDSPEEEVRPCIPSYVFKNLLKGPESGEIEFLGSVNGIICIRYGDRHILSNPALQQFKLLEPCLLFKPPQDYSEHLCMDGFGVSSEEYNFKVITLHKFRHRTLHTWIPSLVVAHLYDSRTNSWRQVDDAPADPDKRFMEHVIFLNGACHWLAHSFSQDRSRMIISFNMTSEVFKQLEFPNCLLEFSNDASHLITLDNRLGLVQHKELYSELDPVEIWVMKEYGVTSSWSKLFVLGPQPIARIFLPWNDAMLMVQVPRYYKQHLPLAHQMKTNEDFDAKLNNYLTSISLRTNETKRFHVLAADITFRALIHEESLVSIK